MFDRWEYTVPANTAEADAVKVECKVSPGVLLSLFMYAPPGCAGLLRSRVFLGERPIAPRSAGSYVAGESLIVDIRNAWEPIKADMPVLNWHLWNLDTVFAHTPWLSAEWISEDEPYEKSISRDIKDLAESLKRVFRL